MNSDGRTRDRCVVETEVLNRINYIGRALGSNSLVRTRHQTLQTLLPKRFLNKSHFIRQNTIKNRTTNSRYFGFILRRLVIIDVAEENWRM
jgi:hypothetical protein